MFADLRRRTQRLSLLALYNLSLALGILILPLALPLRRAGISLPVHRVVRIFQTAYERSTSESRQ